MKQIFLSIQNKLSEISTLKYIDKDWGQLQYDNPPVKSPCALIDLLNIDFKQEGLGHQQAEADIIITIANINTVRSSSLAPQRTSAYAIFDVMEQVHQALQLFSGNNRQFSPLMRTNIQKIPYDKDAEVYQLTYRTSFKTKKLHTPEESVNTKP